MNYYALDTLAQLDPDLCVLRNKPKGIEHLTYKMMSGESIKGEYPKDAHITMSDKEDGIVLGGLVGNTCGLLIVVSAIKNLILEHDQAHDQIEFLPIRILNHKKKLASDDYFIVNPLGTDDVLDLEKSDIKRTKNGDVVAVKHMFLQRQKINPKKALFRPKEDHHVYIAREDWLRKLKSLNLKHSNVTGTTLDISE
jgi:hypothetical protein